MPPHLGTFDLLGRGARELSNALGADGCVVSRALGDVLVQVAEHVEGTGTLQLGMGYLISDYPETTAVVESREPRVVTLADPDTDPAEAYDGAGGERAALELSASPGSFHFRSSSAPSWPLASNTWRLSSAWSRAG